MFDKLRKLIKGDQRPIVRSVTHPMIGTLDYSEDDEAWLTDPKTSTYGFGFYISPESAVDCFDFRPASALVDHAASLASNPSAITQLVKSFLTSQLQSNPSLAADKDEIQKLQLYRVALMWPERPGDGEIELRTSLDSNRIWGCAYIDRKPAPHLSLPGRDDIH